MNDMFVFVKNHLNFQISFGICSTPKLSKYVTVLAFIYHAIQ